MVTDERFFGFMKLLLHRLADLDTKVKAIGIVMRVNYATDFEEKVAGVSRNLEARPEFRAYRECIDTLELSEILDAFEKFEGPAQ